MNNFYFLSTVCSVSITFPWLHLISTWFISAYKEIISGHRYIKLSLIYLICQILLLNDLVGRTCMSNILIIVSLVQHRV